MTPLDVPPQMRTLEWPFLVGVTWLATAFLARGRVGRPESAVLVFAYAVYIALHIVVR